MKDLPDRRASAATDAGEPARAKPGLLAGTQDRLLLASGEASRLTRGARGAVAKPGPRGELVGAGRLAAVPPAVRGCWRDVEGGSCRPPRLPSIDQLAERNPPCRSESSVSVNLHPGPLEVGASNTPSLWVGPDGFSAVHNVCGQLS